MDKIEQGSSPYETKKQQCDKEKLDRPTIREIIGKNHKTHHRKPRKKNKFEWEPIERNSKRMRTERQKNTCWAMSVKYLDCPGWWVYLANKVQCGHLRYEPRITMYMNETVKYFLSSFLTMLYTKCFNLMEHKMISQGELGKLYIEAFYLYRTPRTITGMW